MPNHQHVVPPPPTSLPMPTFGKRSVSGSSAKVRPGAPKHAGAAKQPSLAARPADRPGPPQTQRQKLEADAQQPPLSLVRERLRELLSAGKGMDGSALAQAYKRKFRDSVNASDFGASNMRQLLLQHGSTMGLQVAVCGAGGASGLWVTLAQTDAPNEGDSDGDISGPFIPFVRAVASDGDVEEQLHQDEAARGGGAHGGADAAGAADGQGADDDTAGCGDGAVDGTDAGRAAVSKQALLQPTSGAVVRGAALDDEGSIGHQMLRHLGWQEGRGLGPHGAGELLPVAVGMSAQFEGLGLGCTDVPESLLLESNIEQMIIGFVADASRVELEFEPDLSPADRKRVHELARKHGLKSGSKGVGDARFVTVSKPGARGAPPPVTDEKEIVQHFDKMHARAFSQQSRGAGIGFTAATEQPRIDANAVVPIASADLLERCKHESVGMSALDALPADPAGPVPHAAAQQPIPLASNMRGRRPPPVKKQFADKVISFSSQFSSGDHSARQMLGKPAVFPRNGSEPRAWSAIPRENHGCETARLGFCTPVTPQKVVVYQTFNPGSLVAIRGALIAPGRQAEWRLLWSGARTNTDPNRPAADAFAPPLLPAAAESPVNAIEIELDTTGWGDEFWSEIDAVQLVGTPADVHTTSSEAAAAPRPYLTRQLWETERVFNDRLRFVEATFGAAPTDPDEGMRQAALSMVWANEKLLGCRYPAAVEAQVGRKASAPATGMAVTGELRAQAACG
uniref:G-patch domain-containing protein n=1 Tax=Chrysotila carterae TaxID=13221 RepID=A0A7S4C0K6_CHRCT